VISLLKFSKTGVRDSLIESEIFQSDSLFETVEEVTNFNQGVFPHIMLHTPKVICRYFNSITGCKFGTNCRFSHISNLPQFYSRSHENDEPVKSECVEVTLGSIYSEPTESSSFHHEAVNNFGKKKSKFSSSSKQKSTLRNNHEAVNQSTNLQTSNFSSQDYQELYQDHHDAAVGHSSSDGQHDNTICFVYSKYGRCRFGSKCRFRHEISRQKTTSKLYSKSDNVGGTFGDGSEASEFRNDARQENLNDTARRINAAGRIKPCKYYKFGNCRNGVNCTFYHQDGKRKIDKDFRKLNKVTAKPVTTEIEVETVDYEPKIKVQNPRVRTPRRPPFKPTPIKKELKRNEATDEEIKDLYLTEIQQLKRRFPREKLKTLKEEDTESLYLLKFTSSDPGWVRKYMYY